MSPREACGFIRAECRAWLVEAIADQLDGVTVTRNEPRDWPDETVWLADTIGAVDYPAVGASLPRQDDFSVIVVCACTRPGDDPAEAEARAQQLADAVMAAVSPHPQTAPPAGGIDGVLDVTVAGVDGPDLAIAPEGYGAVMTVTVEFRTRITRGGIPC